MFKKSIAMASATILIVLSLAACTKTVEGEDEWIYETDTITRTVVATAPGGAPLDPTATDASGNLITEPTVTDDKGQVVTKSTTKGTGNQATQGGQNTQGGGKNTTTTQKAPAGSRSAKIWLRSSDKAANQRVTDAINDFNKTNPYGIKAEVAFKVHTGTGMSGFDDVLLPALAAKTGPDVINTGIDSYKNFADITAYMNKYQDDDFSLGDLYEYSKIQARVDGKYYGIPSTGTLQAILVYNKTMFKKHGLDPNKPPTTLEQLDEYAEKMTVKSGNGYSEVGFIPWEWWMNISAHQVPRLFGGKFVDDSGNPTPNTAANLEAFEWLQSYVTKYGYDELNSTNLGGKNTPFDGGRLGMIYTYSGVIQQSASWTFEWGVADMPSKTGEQMATTSTNLMCVFKECKDVEAAFLAARVLCGKKFQTKDISYRANAGADVSCLKSVNQANINLYNPTMRQIINQTLPAIKPEEKKDNTGKVPDDYNQWCSDARDSVLTGKADPAAALKQLEDKVKAWQK